MTKRTLSATTNLSQAVLLALFLCTVMSGTTARRVAGSELAVNKIFQQQTPPPQPPGTSTDVEKRPIKIENISWRGPYCIGVNCVHQAAFSIDVINNSDKTVKAIHWDFALMDMIRKQVYDHFQFETDDKTLAPGKKTRLTKRPDYHETPNYLKAIAIIRRVIFSDGTTWENPKIDDLDDK